MTFNATNPATGERVASYAVTADDALDGLLDHATRTQHAWASVAMADRADRLHATGEALTADASALAELMATEMGKPLAEGRAEVEKCAWVCRYYADHAAAFLAPETIDTGADRSYACCRPLGLVLAIMPWNFPLWQVFRCAAPALMAGNGVVLKHASNVPGCALAIEALFAKAALPAGLFATVLVNNETVSTLLDDPRIHAASLTGSTAAGRAVARAAGQRLKKVVLELGGSDPYLILEDADVDHAARVCVQSRMINSGQSCIAAKRFIVVDAVRDAFEQRVLAIMRTLRVGNPLDDGVDIGPMARVDLRDALHNQVEACLEAGARRLLGGTIPDGPGAFYPPTLLTDVRPGMPAYDDELFGPVASILPVRDEDEAIRLANDTPFGLGAAVFTADLARGERIAADRLNAGCCFVNAMVRSDPRLPFGGIKDSGYGRELSHHGIREFVNIKTVVVGAPT